MDGQQRTTIEEKTNQGHGVPTPRPSLGVHGSCQNRPNQDGGGQQPGATNDWFKPRQTCFFFSLTHSRRRPVVLLWPPGFRTWYAHEGAPQQAWAWGSGRRSGRRGAERGVRGEGCVRGWKQVARQVAEGFVSAPPRSNGDGTHRFRDPIGAVNLLASAVDAQPFSIARMQSLDPWDGRDRAWTPAPASAGSSRPRPRAALLGGEGRVVPCPSRPSHRVPGARMSSRDRDGCPQKPRARQRQGWGEKNRCGAPGPWRRSGPSTLSCHRGIGGVNAAKAMRKLPKWS